MIGYDTDEVWDSFDRKMGSKAWPSDDPADSPIDEFKCKKCGKSIHLQMFGGHAIGRKPFSEVAYERLKDHLEAKHPLTEEKKVYVVDGYVTGDYWVDSVWGNESDAIARANALNKENNNQYNLIDYNVAAVPLNEPFPVQAVESWRIDRYYIEWESKG